MLYGRSLSSDMAALAGTSSVEVPMAMPWKNQIMLSFIHCNLYLVHYKSQDSFLLIVVNVISRTAYGIHQPAAPSSGTH